MISAALLLTFGTNLFMLTVVAGSGGQMSRECNGEQAQSSHPVDFGRQSISMGF